MAIKLTPEQLRAEKKVTLDNVEHCLTLGAQIVTKVESMVGSWDGPAQVAAQNSITEIVAGLRQFGANQTVIGEGLGKLATAHEHNEADSAAKMNVDFGMPTSV